MVHTAQTVRMSICIALRSNPVRCDRAHQDAAVRPSVRGAFVALHAATEPLGLLRRDGADAGCSTIDVAGRRRAMGAEDAAAARTAGDSAERFRSPFLSVCSTAVCVVSD